LVCRVLGTDERLEIAAAASADAAALKPVCQTDAFIFSGDAEVLREQKPDGVWICRV
jgi:hypothetical protein